MQDNTEIWVPVKDFPQYEVSNFGRIKSLFFRRGTKKIPFIRFLNRINPDGYHAVTMSYNGKKLRFKTHRVVASHFLPNPFNLPIVNHIDGNKLNNHISNLEWCTISDNVKHAFKNNLAKGRPSKYSLPDSFEEDVRRIYSQNNNIKHTSELIGASPYWIKKVLENKYKKK